MSRRIQGVDEQQAKLILQPVDDATPQLLITAETMREEDQWPIDGTAGTNYLDVVPGIDVHGASLGRYGKSAIDRSRRRENRQAIAPTRPKIREEHEFGARNRTGVPVGHPRG